MRFSVSAIGCHFPRLFSRVLEIKTQEKEENKDVIGSVCVAVCVNRSHFEMPSNLNLIIILVFGMLTIRRAQNHSGLTQVLEVTRIARVKKKYA